MTRLRAIPSWQITLGVALLALGFLIAAQLASEGPRVRYTTQERTPLGRDRRRAPGAAGRPQGPDPRAARPDPGRRGPGRRRRRTWSGSSTPSSQEARIAAGLIALTGTGIVLQLEDSKAPVPPDGNESDYLVGSRDIRAVVEELWGAGAEAIAVNGERITPTSAIIDVGSSLLVNSAYLTPPYQVTGTRPARPVRTAQRVGRVRGLRPRPERGLRHPRLAGRAGLGGHAGVRRDRHPALLAAARVAVGRAVAVAGAEPAPGG